MKKLIALLCVIAILGSFCVPVMAAESKVPVVAKVPDGWEIAYLYAWDAQNNGNAPWPGIPMSKLDGWFYAYMPDNMENVIINNGTGVQTDDLMVDSGVPVCVQAADVNNAYVSYDVPVKVPAEGETPKLTVTVHAGVPEAWTSCYLYAWNDGASNASWPGVAMTKGDDGFWAAELLPGFTNVVIAQKDGGLQSVDLTVTGNECWIAFTSFNEEGKFDANVTESAPQDFVAPEMPELPEDPSEEPPVEPPVEPTGTMTFYARVPEDWTNVRLWAWNDQGANPEGIGTWPGNLIMTLGEDGWYSCTIPAGYTNMLINADGDLQTGDMAVLPVDQVWVDCTDPSLITIFYEDPNQQGPGPVFTPTITVRAGVPENWTGCYLHVWNENGPYTIWPGVEMDLRPNGFWAAEVPAEYTHAVISQKNGTAQSVDLTLTGGECWVLFTGLNEEGKFEADVTADAPENFVPPVVPDVPVEPPILDVEDMTVYAKMPAEWINVRLWAWDDAGATPEGIGSWPGNMNMTKGEDGWYSYTLPCIYRNVLINADGGLQTGDLTVDPVEAVWLDCTDLENITVSYTKPGEPASGVAVSGALKTFGDASAATTLELWADGAAVYSLTTTEAAYSFENVALGSYTLKVSKEDHVTREYAITVEADLTQDVKIHLIGDVTGDGRVNVADTSKVYSHVKGTAPLSDYAFACADVDANGRINVADTSKVYSHVKGTKPLW